MTSAKMNPLERLPTIPITIQSLAQTPLSQLANLPAEPGIYFAVDEACRVWYIGIADSIRARLAGHDRLDDFRESGVSAIAWKTEYSSPGRRSMERELIERFHPPLNAQHNFNSLPAIDFGLSPDQEIERYFRLRIQQKILELEIELLKPNIVTRCEQMGGKITHRLGTINRQSYKSWAFSEKVAELQEALKQTKKAERENGIATVKSVTVSPVARINAAALSAEVAVFVSQIEDAQPGDDMDSLEEVA